MFDLTSSKLFLLAIVALLVIGPKDFPVLLRTIGKYMGIIRGHAREFRAQFDEAMRESEFAQLKKDVESIAQETEASLNATSQSVHRTFAEAGKGMEAQLDGTFSPAPAPPSPSVESTDAAAALPESAPGSAPEPEPEPAATSASEPAEAPPAVEPAPAAAPLPDAEPSATPASQITPAPAAHTAERTGA